MAAQQYVLYHRLHTTESSVGNAVFTHAGSIVKDVQLVPSIGQHTYAGCLRLTRLHYQIVSCSGSRIEWPIIRQDDEEGGKIRMQGDQL